MERGKGTRKYDENKMKKQTDLEKGNKKSDGKRHEIKKEVSEKVKEKEQEKNMTTK